MIPNIVIQWVEGRKTGKRKTVSERKEGERGRRQLQFSLPAKLQFCTCNGSATANVQCEDGNKKEQPKLTAL